MAASGKPTFSNTVKHIFFTGPPGIGKTTLVSRIASMLKEKVEPGEIAGFITEEVRQGGRRQGFDVVTAGSERFTLSRAGGQGQPRVGKYTVHMEEFEESLDHLFPPKDAPAPKVMLLDEVGRMELFSEKFKECVTNHLERGTYTIGTIPVPKKGRQIPFVQQICDRSDTTVIEVTEENRDPLVKDVVASLLPLISTA